MQVSSIEALIDMVGDLYSIINHMNPVLSFSVGSVLGMVSTLVLSSLVIPILGLGFSILSFII